MNHDQNEVELGRLATAYRFSFSVNSSKMGLYRSSVVVASLRLHAWLQVSGVIYNLEAFNYTSAHEALPHSLFSEWRYLKCETMVPLVLNRVSVT